jgi:hypothetical protein
MVSWIRCWQTGEDDRVSAEWDGSTEFDGGADRDQDEQTLRALWDDLRKHDADLARELNAESPRLGRWRSFVRAYWDTLKRLDPFEIWWVPI